MNNTVKVSTCRTDSNELIGISKNNSDYGFIRIESTDEVQFGAGGWLNSKKRSTLIKGKISDLTSWVKSNNIQIGSTFIGKIVVKEQAGVPFYEGQEPKRAGQDGEILHKDGMPIFRQTEFTLDVNAPDTLVQHDNVLSAASRMMANNDITMK